MMRAMRSPRHSAILVALFCGLAGLAPEAHAYLDPSTGSMILSAIVGLFATIGLAVKTYWYKLRNLLTRRGAAPATSAPAPQQPAATQSTQDPHEAGQAERPS
jgi:peptidoglycan/LPS O-acetylase OafA/YrhL